MTTSTFTPEQKLAVIKHLAGGKTAGMVATIMGTKPEVIIDLAKGHGFPDTLKLQWAADILEKNLEKDAALPERPLTTGGVIAKPTTVVRGERGPEAVVPAHGTVVRPDDVRALIAGAKAHSSKRIQAQADRTLDAISKLRQLLVEDEQKNHEKRKAAAEKAAAKAEVERLEAALKAAKAKLKGGIPTKSAAPAAPKSHTNFKSTAPRGEYPCRNEGCDKVIDTPQGRGLHERQHCAHRAEAGVA